MNSRSPVQMTEKQLRLIEKLGVFYEQQGLMQPAAARILALLLVSDSIELTFEEVYETLNLSKSATSNALNFLLNTEKVEYITQPGERRRYFRFKMRSFTQESFSYIRLSTFLDEMYCVIWFSCTKT